VTSVAFRVTSPALDRAVAAFGRLPADVRADLPAVLGAVAETGARRRISEEKRGPDGRAWPRWSEKYKASRTRAQGLLVDSGRLLDTVAFETRGADVAVGASRVYAAIHQFGGAEVGKPGLPARPYLGVSAEDEAAMLEAVETFVAARLGARR
jgi:phage virion morphogenesis protein